MILCIMHDNLYIIDGFSLIFRSYYALMRTPLTFNGMNTAAIYGFFQTISSLYQNEDIKNIALVFDPPGPSFRKDIYTDYKAQRPSPPEDLQQQIPIILTIAKESGLPFFSIDSYEADDVIASLAVQTKGLYEKCIIVTSDKDLLQLIDTRVSMLKPSGKGKFEHLGIEQVEEQWGLEPSQIGDLLAIMGDSADNIPGVPGIGKIGATKLLQEHRTLQGIYENIALLKPGMQKKLQEGKELAELSRVLVTLKTDVSIEKQPENFEITKNSLGKIHKALKEYGIETVFHGMSEEEPSPEKPKATLHSSHNYVTVNTESDLVSWIDHCKKNRVYSLLCFCDEKELHNPLLVGIALSPEPGEGCYIPCASQTEETIPIETILTHLSTLIDDPSLQYIGHDIKKDIKALSHHSLREWQSIYFDTMIAAWLLDSNEAQYELPHISQRYLSQQLIGKEQIDEVQTSKTKEIEFSSLPQTIMTQYAGERTDACLRLHAHFLPLLSAQNLYSLFITIEMQLVPILARMELRGIYARGEELQRQSDLLYDEITKIQQSIRSEVGYDFNMNSTQQLSTILFEQRGLTPIKKTKTGYSTDSDVLEILGKQDPLPLYILRYRMLVKLKSTYLDALQELITPQTPTIHTTFQQTVAATGRLSSKDPNLQNIPIKTEEGRLIRTAFEPRPGNLFIGADYSQIELVVLAHLSKDEALLTAFRNRSDVHTQTASLIFNKSLESVSPEDRNIAKMINFGVIYGMSAFRLSNELGIPRKTAQQFIQNYFETYRGIAEFSESIITNAEETGYVTTLMNRRRAVPHLRSKNFNLRSADQRIAVNTVIQGSAADIIKKAMIDMNNVIRNEKLPCSMVLQVHDELLLESKTEQAQEILNRLISVMENAVDLSVPLSANGDVGNSWGEFH